MIIIFFSILDPHLFPTVATLHQVLEEGAISGLIAISLVIPLASGEFDISVGYIAGFSGVLAAWFLANTGMSPWLVIPLTMLCTTAIGAVNGFVVVVLKVNSLIGTLGTGAIILAATGGIANQQVMTTRVLALSNAVGNRQVWGITLPVFVMVGAMLIVGYVLEQTTTGRAWYAVGFDAAVARLAGLRTKMLQFSAFLISGLISGLAGIILAATVGAADPTAGPSYLLPSFAAVFLGATQFRHGRFNPWGAVVAVLMLSTGEVGLSLADAPEWAPNVFLGVVLITALAITRAEQS
ncbi:MAG TPA: ABC transporter permease [Acidimicrobiales bacterium]|nr:ABC transporter permease [Acidimicrobiales bacterium]